MSETNYRCDDCGGTITATAAGRECEDCHKRFPPVRSEPADFGHGDSTGVQDL